MGSASSASAGSSRDEHSLGSTDNPGSPASVSLPASLPHADMAVSSSGSMESDAPVVIVPLLSPSASSVSRPGSPTFDLSQSNSWTLSSPMARSVKAKKRRAILALSIPLVLGIGYRFFQVADLTLPTGKAVDINSPPVPLPEGTTLQQLLQVKQQQNAKNPQQTLLAGVGGASHITRLASLQESAGTEDGSLPIVVDRGEKLPVGVGGGPLKASEALMCRDSVINYVINATNGKDECTGLQKAFDETCSTDEEGEGGDIVHNVDEDAVVNEEWQGWRGRQQRRRLQKDRRREILKQQKSKSSSTTDNAVKPKEEHGNSSGWKLWLGYGHGVFQQYFGSSRADTISGAEKPFFFADDRVAEAYLQARRQTILQNEQFETRRRLQKTQQSSPQQLKQRHVRRTQQQQPIQQQQPVQQQQQIPQGQYQQQPQGQFRQQPMTQFQQPQAQIVQLPQGQYRNAQYQNSQQGQFQQPQQALPQAQFQQQQQPKGQFLQQQQPQGQFQQIQQNNNLQQFQPTGQQLQQFSQQYQQPVTLQEQQQMQQQLEEILQRQQQSSAGLNSSLIENVTAPAKKVPKLSTSLHLPTGRAHLSDKTLQEALLLKQEDKVISSLIKATENITNSTAVKNEAQEDAEKSSKAVSDTNELVSAVLNDPTSIEARTCCASIMNVYHENCSVDAEEEISDKRLFMVVLVMAFCGMVKSLIRHFKIRWLPEAAGCILVGVMSGYASTFIPHHEFNFDGNYFLRILVPPIVFEAALSIDKKSFNRHLVPIMLFATLGTLLATVLTATIVYQGTLIFPCETIPYIESLIFGALISSIDPIAVLSVLSNMGMTDTDTLYVLVFGESLLNDGVAMVLFQTLIQFLDVNVVIDGGAITSAVVHFFVVAIGSVLVGVGAGIMCTVYYWAFHGCQTPLVEVLMFCCWALFPYYVCDGIHWSGIVAAVTVGFVMDIYVIGTHGEDKLQDSQHSHGSTYSGEQSPRKAERPTGRRKIFSGEGHLSAEARTHIHFVTEIVATMMETAIFAYLGLFLFSYRYHWNMFHTVIAILACCLSRAIMIPILTAAANWITSLQKYQNRCRFCAVSGGATGVIIDKKMQLVLWFAGLRGAMSFALVEGIPLFDAVTGEGTRVKAELKAMTSASIMFTVFVLGGSTSYLMDHIGLAPSAGNTTPRGTPQKDTEMVPLLGKEKNDTQMNGSGHENDELAVRLDSRDARARLRKGQSQDAMSTG